jgi:hypothetical protein
LGKDRLHHKGESQGYTKFLALRYFLWVLLGGESRGERWRSREVKGGKVGRWEGGKVGRSRGEGRGARDTIESGTQELKRIKVSRGGAEASRQGRGGGKRWEGGKVEGRRAKVEGHY